MDEKENFAARPILQPVSEEAAAGRGAGGASVIDQFKKLFVSKDVSPDEIAQLQQLLAQQASLHGHSDTAADMARISERLAASNLGAAPGAPAPAACAFMSGGVRRKAGPGGRPGGKGWIGEGNDERGRHSGMGRNPCVGRYAVRVSSPGASGRTGRASSRPW